MGYILPRIRRLAEGMGRKLRSVGKLVLTRRPTQKDDIYWDAGPTTLTEMMQ